VFADSTEKSINKQWVSLLQELSINRFSRDVIFTNNSIEILKSQEFVFFPKLYGDKEILSLIKFRYECNNIKQFNNNFYMVLKQKPISD
jgi:hypothetical protein